MDFLVETHTFLVGLLRCFLHLGDVTLDVLRHFFHGRLSLLFHITCIAQHIKHRFRFEVHRPQHIIQRFLVLKCTERLLLLDRLVSRLHKHRQLYQIVHCLVHPLSIILVLLDSSCDCDLIFVTPGPVNLLEQVYQVGRIILYLRGELFLDLFLLLPVLATALTPRINRLEERI